MERQLQPHMRSILNPHPALQAERPYLEPIGCSASLELGYWLNSCLPTSATTSSDWEREVWVPFLPAFRQENKWLRTHTLLSSPLYSSAHPIKSSPHLGGNIAGIQCLFGSPCPSLGNGSRDCSYPSGQVVLRRPHPPQTSAEQVGTRPAVMKRYSGKVPFRLLEVGAGEIEGQ